jgi:hypothetical protein
MDIRNLRMKNIKEVTKEGLESYLLAFLKNKSFYWKKLEVPSNSGIIRHSQLYLDNKPEPIGLKVTDDHRLTLECEKSLFVEFNDMASLLHEFEAIGGIASV